MRTATRYIVNENTNKDRLRWLKNIYQSDFVLEISKHIVCFFMGLISSRATIFGGYSPFGVAICAAVPYKYLLSCSFGAIIGCLFPFMVVDNIRYIASILAVVALRWVLKDFLVVSEHPLFSPILAAVPLFITGIAMSFLLGDYDSSILVVTVIETLMSGGCAFFFLATSKIISGSRGLSALTYQELACVTLCLCTVLLALSSIMIGSVSVGRILSILLILFCAQYGGVVGGCVAGVATGAMLSFSSPDITYIAGAYAFAGLVSGLFSKLSKVTIAVGFILANGIIVLQTGNSDIAFTCLYEVAISTVIFMVIPKKVGERFSKVFDPSMGGPNISGLKDSIMLRMNFASKTLNDINSCVDNVSHKLDNLNISDVTGVYLHASDEICKNCNLKLLCWERDKEKTMNMFSSFSSILESGQALSENNFPEYFKQRCSKAPLLSQTINDTYHSYLINNVAQNRVSEIRDTVKNQFNSMSYILNDLSEEVSLYDRFDYIASEKIKNLILSFGLSVTTVSCRINKYDILNIEIELDGNVNLDLVGKELFSLIAKVSDRKLDVPSISATPSSTKILISEKATFKISIGYSQHTCNDVKLCGDSFKFFYDGIGNAIGIISDGMGTGGRAAVDSAMTTAMFEKLTKSGIKDDSALRLLNSALIVKSSEESLSTLDIVKINLFTGETLVEKAGSTFTFVRRKGYVYKIDLPSLPLGILTDVSFNKKHMVLNRNDVVLMVSDGMIASGEEWIIKELQKYDDSSEDEFAKKLIEQAKFRRNDGHDDDITALVIRLI